MRIAVLSDVHVLGPEEHEKEQESVAGLGHGLPALRRRWEKALYRVRRRFWNWHPESRQACFHRALDVVDGYGPEWVIANGDYGGDTAGTGLSDNHTFLSARGVVQTLRERFPDRCRFVFGDHDLGKYATNLKSGGIRLESLRKGEEELGIRSFWHESHKGFELVGINSVLFALDLFLPEALKEEVEAWRALREKHLRQVSEAFEGFSREARILLFCHDPSALNAISELPAVSDRMHMIEFTVLGHLHTPMLLTLAQWLPDMPKINPQYPVARIIAKGMRDTNTWAAFKPVLCPSTFGAGHHISGGVLFIETNADNELVILRQRIRIREEG